MRIIVYTIPFTAVLYILYLSLYAPVLPDNPPIPTGSDSTVYTIDVGAQDSKGDAVLQGPFDRTSYPISKGNVTYRFIEKDLVYFNSPVKQNFSRVKVEMKFIDTIPQGYEFKVGMKNKKEWSYVWNTLYNPFYASLGTFNLTGEDSRIRVYSLNANITTPISSFLSSPSEGSTIATDAPVEIYNDPAATYKESGSSIGELRGVHTFYIYTKGNLSLSVKKQDLNWYNGPDVLDINLYSPANELIKNITISDDGNLGKDNIKGHLQNGTLGSVVKEGIYKVTMRGGSDILIRKIELNNGNIVVQNPFLAGVQYTYSTRFNLYTRAATGDRLGFMTYHNEGLQTIRITNGNYTRSLNISTVNSWHYIDLPSSNELYKIEIPKGNILIDSDSYFSFSKDSYFTPQAIKILPLQDSIDWLKINKVDYIIIPNSQESKDGNWTIASVEYDLSDAYINNNTLNFAISAPHLNKYNYSVPVDWIRIYLEE
ncbi:hypothetical protein MNV_980041 [Candidatus Methanoperedens nitroreducens]|uniref:Uncharacterized protein n=1 Tax=Candidatus Methanoperedens nitratireducens TaxID=1392998 RepID=A0A284VUP8_9EURY|nr:hypothetical protein MNV_980041 [Candidatus Methanoperedens nitroreducens]